MRAAKSIVTSIWRRSETSPVNRGIVRPSCQPRGRPRPAGPMASHCIVQILTVQLGYPLSAAVRNPQCAPACRRRGRGRGATKLHAPNADCDPRFNRGGCLVEVRSSRPSSEERITVDVELPSLAFPARAAEGIDRRTDPNVDESDLFQHLLPGCARQTTGNSGRPKIDVSDRRFGHRLAIRNVRELQPSAWTQDAMNLRKGRPLVGAKVHHTVADDDVWPIRFRWANPPRGRLGTPRCPAPVLPSSAAILRASPPSCRRRPLCRLVQPGRLRRTN